MNEMVSAGIATGSGRKRIYCSMTGRKMNADY
jgi:hypothetical protein